MARAKRAYDIQKESSNSYIIIVTVIALAASAISTYSVVIVLFGMLPGLIAMIVDQEPNRYISRIVLSFNSMGLSIYLSKILLAHEGANALAIQFIVEPKTWMVIYSAAALGWAVYWSFPYFSIAINNLKIQLRVQQLTLELEELTQEWGSEIRQNQ